MFVVFILSVCLLFLISYTYELSLTQFWAANSKFGFTRVFLSFKPGPRLPRLLERFTFGIRNEAQLGISYALFSTLP